MGGIAGRDRSPLTRLSGRLLAVARQVPRGTAVADIGCGDASLAVYLARARGCRVIATEASPACSAVALRRVAAAGAAVEVRRGRGLAPLRPGEVEVIIIAGMGGITISQILEERPAGVVPERFVLQPMERAAYLRRWLYDRRWPVLDEDLVRERGRIYEIIVTRPPGAGAEAGPAAGRLLAGGEVGEVLVARGHPLLGALLREKIRKYRRLLAGMQQSRRPGAAETREAAAAVLAEMEDLAARLAPGGEG